AYGQIRAGRLLQIGILPPLPGVAIHVEQSEIVWLQAGDRLSPVFGIADVPGILSQHRLRHTIEPARTAAGTARIFPLRFGGETIPRPSKAISRQRHPVLYLVH